MISVADKDIIRRLYFKQQKSIRWIARELTMSRKTVRKALLDGDEPKYNLTRPKPKPVTSHIRPLIKQWLQEEKQYPAKQRFTARGIFNRLLDEYDYQGSESSVRRVVAELRQAEKETYIPLAFEPGTNAQCDWGSGYVYIDDEYTEVQLFCIRMTSSRQPFVMAFPHQKQEAFFEGHVQAFNRLGGVPATITYDNLKTAVPPYS
jgi:transposase